MAIAKRRRLFWQIFPSFFAISLASLLFVSWYWSSSLRDLFTKRTEVQLEQQSALIKIVLEELFSNQKTALGITKEDKAHLEELIRGLSQAVSAKIRVELSPGEFLGELDDEVDNDSLIVTKSLKLPNSYSSSVRLSRSKKELKSEIKKIHSQMILLGVGILLVVGLLSVIIARNLSKPLKELKGAIQRFSKGDFANLNSDLPTDEITRLADAMNELASIEILRKDFVANVSHELRTPITSIKGFVETLLEGKVDNPEDQARFLKIISNQVIRLEALIEDLLRLSKLEKETENSELIFKDYVLSDIIASAASFADKKARDKNITISIKPSEKIIVHCNDILIEQAIINLIVNAVNYSEEASSIEVEACYISTNKKQKEIQIKVLDHGIGIAEEDLTRLFERFYRVEKSRTRKDGGTGLGLAIVKHVAQAHGGRVEVKSILGEGSTFYIYLPSS